MKAASQADRTFDITNKWEDCKRLCRAPRVVLDCGANRGQAARNLREAYPHARLFCFEPVSSVIPHLEPVARELNAEIVQAAVSNRTGTAEINLTESHESNSLLGFLADNNPLEKYHRVRGTEQVRTWRLDDWCAQAGVAPAEVDVIKLDVQGAELMALDGESAATRARAFCAATRRPARWASRGRPNTSSSRLPTRAACPCRARFSSWARKPAAPAT